MKWIDLTSGVTAVSGKNAGQKPLERHIHRDFFRVNVDLGNHIFGGDRAHLTDFLAHLEVKVTIVIRNGFQDGTVRKEVKKSRRLSTFGNSNFLRCGIDQNRLIPTAPFLNLSTHSSQRGNHTADIFPFSGLEFHVITRLSLKRVRQLKLKTTNYIKFQEGKTYFKIGPEEGQGVAQTCPHPG